VIRDKEKKPIESKEEVRSITEDGITPSPACILYSIERKWTEGNT